MMTLVPVGLIYIYTTMLTAAGRMKRLGMIILSGMVINIIMNLILIPRCQAPGAAWAALSAQSLVALASFMAVERNLLSSQTVKQVALFVLMLLVTFAAGRLTRLAGMSWMAAAGMQMVAGMAFALAFRMIEPLKSLKLIIAGTESV
jgi:peptidoglycan biosynthesis protein MviN/MurJ (putative lipid II flippase)